MPGPPPSFVPRRRNARLGATVLPAEGRPGPVPTWPLPGRPLKAELDLWSALWSSPQAVASEQLHLVRVVGRYCRILVESGGRRAPTSTTVEARQLEDRLGGTPKAMRSLLWLVVDTTPQPLEPDPTARRQHLSAVGPDNL